MSVLHLEMPYRHFFCVDSDQLPMSGSLFYRDFRGRAAGIRTISMTKNLLNSRLFLKTKKGIVK